MIKITASLFIATLLSLCLNLASAQAQYVRTCVSAKGSDANTCHCSQPCRSFARAHDQTLEQGVITVLDPGNYGRLDITKSISIVNDGVGEASILVSGGATGITINADPAANVNLRGLTIQGVGGDSLGVLFNTGSSATMENCVVRNHSGSGLHFNPRSKTSIAVSNTLVADNGGHGIVLQPLGSDVVVKAVFNRVKAFNNSGRGLVVSGSASVGEIDVSVADSIASSNGGSGFGVVTRSALSNVMLVRSLAATNGIGLEAAGVNATLRIGQTTVTGNRASSSIQNGAVLRSYGDNYITGNGDGDPAPTTIAKK